MEQSDVFSQVNLNFGGKNRQNSLRHFRKQAEIKQRELKKQIIEDISQQYGSPHQSNYHAPQPLKTIENIPKQIENLQMSQKPIQYTNKHYQDTQVTETILKILEYNKKLLNLKALKLKSQGQQFNDGDYRQQSKYTFKLRNMNKVKRFKIHKLEEIAIEPTNQNYVLYDQVEGNKPQRFFEYQKKEEQMMEKNKNQKNIIEFQNYQLDIIKMKNHSDLQEVRNAVGQNNLFLLEDKLLLINIQQLLNSLISSESQSSISKQNQESIQILNQRITQQVSALENTLIDNEVALKTIGESSLETMQKSLESGLMEFKMNGGDQQYEGSQRFIKHQQQILEKVRSIEKLRYNEQINKKAIEQYKIQTEEYESHLRCLIENTESPDNLKVNLKRILDMHKTIKQLQEENDTINKKNELLNQQLYQLKSESRSLSETLSMKINQLHQKLGDQKLEQHPVSQTLKLKDFTISELNRQKGILDSVIEENKKDYESKTMNLIMKLEQTQNVVNNLETKLIEEQANKAVQNKQNGNPQSFEAVQQLSNIVLSKKLGTKGNGAEVDLLTQFKQEFNLERQQIKSEYEEKIKGMNEQMIEKDKKIQELNEKIQSYLNIAFYLNDLLIEINDIDDYKVIRQKLDNNRENIVKFYGLTSVDFNQQSPDINAKKKGKFDMLGKGFVKSFDVKYSPFIDEQFSRISHDSDFVQNIKDLKKRSESNLLNDLHILENMGVQSMSEYMHTRLSRIMQENFELKDENIRYKQVIESLKIERKSGRDLVYSKQSPFKQQNQDDPYQIKLDDIPDNYMYALYMQSITIEEMLKQAEEVQMITSEIEKNQDEQQRLLRESLEFQQQSQKQLMSNQESTLEQQKQQYQPAQQQPYSNQQTVTTTIPNQYKNLLNSVIQEQSNEDEEINDTYFGNNPSNSIQQQQQQINYSNNYGRTQNNNYQYNP